MVLISCFWVKLRYLFSIFFIVLMLDLVLLCLGLVGIRVSWSFSCVSGVCRLWFILVRIVVCCLRWCLICVCIFRKVWVVWWILVVLAGWKWVIFWFWLNCLAVLVRWWMGLIWLWMNIIEIVVSRVEVLMIYNRKICLVVVNMCLCRVMKCNMLLFILIWILI